MRIINFNTWQVYYMDNDGRKKVINKNLSYNRAVKLCQQWATQYQVSCNYESI